MAGAAMTLPSRTRSMSCDMSWLSGAFCLFSSMPRCRNPMQAEKSSRMQRFESALESLERRAFVELFERRPDGERIVGLRHREVEQAELQAREMKLGVDVERGAHLRHGFGIFPTLGELGAEQVTQLRVSRVAHDGGS